MHFDFPNPKGYLQAEQKKTENGERRAKQKRLIVLLIFIPLTLEKEKMPRLGANPLTLFS